MTIRAILFDFGQVLNTAADEAEAAERRARLAERLGMSSEALWPYLFEGEAAQRWMTGRLSWDEFWQAVLSPFGITAPADIEAFASELFQGSEGIHPEMVALLGELKGRYKLAVISNASWTSAELLAILTTEMGLAADLFDVVLTSRTAGVLKPNRAIYEMALDQLGVRPEEAVFIDDLVSFTGGAAALGIHTHSFIGPAELRRFLVGLGVLASGAADDVRPEGS